MQESNMTSFPDRTFLYNPYFKGWIGKIIFNFLNFIFGMWGVFLLMFSFNMIGHFRTCEKLNIGIW